MLLQCLGVNKELLQISVIWKSLRYLQHIFIIYYLLFCFTHFKITCKNFIISSFVLIKNIFTKQVQFNPYRMQSDAWRGAVHIILRTEAWESYPSYTSYIIVFYFSEHLVMFKFVLQQSFSNFQTADQFSNQSHSWMISQMLDVRHLHN